MDQKKVYNISWVDTANQLEDLLTKRGVAVEPLVETINTDDFTNEEDTGVRLICYILSDVGFK